MYCFEAERIIGTYKMSEPISTMVWDFTNTQMAISVNHKNKFYYCIFNDFNDLQPKCIENKEIEIEAIAFDFFD